MIDHPEDRVGPESDPYLDRVEPEEWEDQDEDQEVANCHACSAEWPLEEMQAVGDEHFGPCCPQECLDCPAVPTQMDDNEPVCDACADKRRAVAPKGEVHPLFAQLFTSLGLRGRES
jgi:hypothetical protein